MACSWNSFSLHSGGLQLPFWSLWVARDLFDLGQQVCRPLSYIQAVCTWPASVGLGFPGAFAFWFSQGVVWSLLVGGRSCSLSFLTPVDGCLSLALSSKGTIDTHQAIFFVGKLVCLTLAHHPVPCGPSGDPLDRGPAGVARLSAAFSKHFQSHGLGILQGSGTIYGALRRLGGAWGCLNVAVTRRSPIWRSWGHSEALLSLVWALLLLSLLLLLYTRSMEQYWLVLGAVPWLLGALRFFWGNGLAHFLPMLKSMLGFD
jgi:hypothetical protein